MTSSLKNAALRDEEQVKLQTPRRREDIRTPSDVLEDLVLRRTMLDGKTTMTELSEKVMLAHSVLDEIVQELREKRLIDILGMEAMDFRFELTELGRDTARRTFENCRYAGPAPVTLDEYAAVVHHQSPEPEVNHELMKAAFSDLVVPDELLNQVGPAIIAKGAMFLYGPPGTGKTSIAERMIRVHQDAILVPHAVEVDRQIIVVYDPVVHEAIAEQPDGLDPRWIMCRRPSVVTGGELTNEMLDLKVDSNTGVYLAPLQMKANNGILVVDDFGRQRMTPDELLNRWIVPLDRGIDFLSLSYGVKFTVPFLLKVVFSTNLDPTDLGDEAFFRRIHNKIYIGSITPEHFDWVLVRVAKANDIPVDKDAAETLREICLSRGAGDLRPYLPADICRILKAICQYEGLPVEMNKENLERVADIYFAHGFDVGTAVTHEPIPMGSETTADRPVPAAAEPTDPDGAAIAPPPSLATIPRDLVERMAAETDNGTDDTA